MSELKNISGLPNLGIWHGHNDSMQRLRNLIHPVLKSLTDETKEAATLRSRPRRDYNH